MSPLARWGYQITGEHINSNNKKIESLTTLSQKIREYFKPKPKPKYSYWNPYADKGVDDEYYINEIIGIDELPYEEFIKEEKDAK